MYLPFAAAALFQNKYDTLPTHFKLSLEIDTHLLLLFQHCNLMTSTCTDQGEVLINVDFDDGVCCRCGNLETECKYKGMFLAVSVKFHNHKGSTWVSKTI